MANVPWPILFCSIYNTWCLCHTPSIFLPRLSLKPAEAEFTWSLMRQCLLCTILHYVPVFSQVTFCCGRWDATSCLCPEELKTAETFINWALTQTNTGNRAKETFFYRGAGGPSETESLPLYVWLSRQCVLSSLCVHSCSSHNQRWVKT